MAKATDNLTTSRRALLTGAPVSRSGTIEPAAANMAPATTMEALLTVQTSRRSLLAHAATASAGLASVTPATTAAAAPAADPVLRLFAERDRLSKAAVAADERVLTIRRSLPPEAFAVPAAPAFDPGSPRIVADAARLRAEPAFQHALELLDQWRAEESAEQRDQEATDRRRVEEGEPDKLLAESGYTAAREERDALDAAAGEIARVIAETPATSVAGAIAKLKTGSQRFKEDAADDPDSLGSDERLILSAIDDLERLLARAAPGAPAA